MAMRQRPALPRSAPNQMRTSPATATMMARTKPPMDTREQVERGGRRERAEAMEQHGQNEELHEEQRHAAQPTAPHAPSSANRSQPRFSLSIPQAFAPCGSPCFTGPRCQPHAEGRLGRRHGGFVVPEPAPQGRINLTNPKLLAVILRPSPSPVGGRPA